MEATISRNSSHPALALTRSDWSAASRDFLETAENMNFAVETNITARMFQFEFDPTQKEIEHYWKITLGPHVTARRSDYWGFASRIISERTDSEEIFEAIQALHLSNRPRDWQIAARITALHRAALSEGEHMRSKSLGQFKDFFLAHPDLGLPKITLTPDETIRARWIHGPGNFVALEFTGEPLVKLVAEIPRPNGLTARHFSSEAISNVVAVGQACGASFA